MLEYEYRDLEIPRGTTRNATRQALTEHAEYGRWEIARVRVYRDGSRRVTLCRKIIRRMRTM